MELQPMAADTYVDRFGKIVAQTLAAELRWKQV